MTTFALPPTASATAAATLSRTAGLVSAKLDAAVARLHPTLRPPVNHHLAGGGKGVRAALTLLSATSAGGAESCALVGAVAIELMHNFSLVHDDVIDGDEVRHHCSTVWAKYGVGPAIIAGDALAALALEVLLEEPTGPRSRAARCLIQATQAMIGGQAQDMAFEDRSSVTVAECLEMEHGKTSALLAAAASLGAILAEAPDQTVDALALFGAHVGTSFQAIDDVLGIWGDPGRTGKSVGSDLLAHKKTLPVALAMGRLGDRSRELADLLQGDVTPARMRRAAALLEASGARHEAMALADEHLDLALLALESVPLVPGPKAELVALAQFVTERDR